MAEGIRNMQLQTDDDGANSTNFDSEWFREEDQTTYKYLFFRYDVFVFVVKVFVSRFRPPTVEMDECCHGDTNFSATPRLHVSDEVRMAIQNKDLMHSLLQQEM